MKRLVRSLAAIIVAGSFLVALAYGSQLIRPLPDGISFDGQTRPATNVSFLSDSTYIDSAGIRKSDQEIFDAIFKMITNARAFVLVDMFLFNEFQGASPERTRMLADELTDSLVEKKRTNPKIEIVVVSDPINTVYGGERSEHFERLEAAGVSVVVTDLDALRDSNPVYSLFWRSFVRPFGNSDSGYLPNPFGAGSATIRSYLRLFNFKANHRKLVITDDNGNLAALVTSANPHDGSSAHSNVALKFSGEAAADLLETERAVVAFSGGPKIAYSYVPLDLDTDVFVRVVTEHRIEDTVVATLQRAGAGDRIDLAMFYLSDRDVVRELVAAHRRGAALRVLLDPNKDAFGHEKNGIPNRQVAHELTSAGVSVRWCDTHGEQCHSKLLLSRRANEATTLILGSANLTRRNLENFNLETNVVVTAESTFPVMQDAGAWFETNWTNTPDRQMSVAYEKYAEKSLVKTGLYRFMEASGLSSF